ncbi:MAG: DUF1963 domain-containing protein [Bacteroidota bacterium]
MSSPSPHIRIGTLAFALDSPRCGVPPHGGGLSVELVARAADPEAAHAAGLVHDYNRGSDGGLLRFRLTARSVYGPGGVPAGHFEIERGRTQDPYARFQVEGADYPLGFNGAVALAEGRATVRGQFACSYDTRAPSFDVDIEVTLDVETIDWSGYVFGSLDEIARAPQATVQRATLAFPEFETLPPEITRLGALRSLTLENRQAHGFTLPLRDLTPEIGRLRSLEALAINGAALADLPPEIGQLENLEALTVGTCDLTSVPDAVWHLPRLKQLSLAGNRLGSIPADLDLPALTSLNLSRNALRTVPAALADLPALDHLALEGNPLEALPDALRSVPRLKLTIEERQRLLPVAYPGADDGYPEAVYRIDGWPERKQQLDALLEAAGADLDARVRTFAEQTARPSIGFQQVETASSDRLGRSRFGGMPDLPEGWDYPRFGSSESDLAYEFIAQIDCEALAPLQDYLPRAGVLYVFLSTIHDVYGRGTAYPIVLVRHYDGPRAALRPGSRFALTRDDYFEMLDPEYEPMEVAAAARVSLPPSYPLRQNTYLFRNALAAVGGDEDDFIDAYQGVDEDVGEQEFNHELGGYGFSQHELPEIEVALAAGGDPADWFTLLTVQSRGSMQWGDAGDLYVVIHKADLARSDFSRVQATMYSS